VTQADEVVVVEVSEGPEMGRQLALKPNIKGIVTATHHRLVKGMSLDDALADSNLLTVGKLKSLDVEMGQMGVRATSEGAIFQKWRVELNGVVNEGDPIAEIMDNAHQMKVLISPKYGVLEKMQEGLRPGFPLHDTVADMPGAAIAVIGKFPKVEAGHLEEAVEVPQDAVFLGWLVKNGQYVRKGQPVCQVILPDRRLSQYSDRHTPRIISGSEQNVTSPSEGVVSNLQPLKQGMRIQDVQQGNTIATVRGNLIFYHVFAVIVCCCLWICFFGLFRVMRKHKPIYNRLIFEENTPSECSIQMYEGSAMLQPQERKENKKEEKEGLQLDFVDRWSDQAHGSREIEETEYKRSYYAKYKPLGIKCKDHKHEKQPIIVEGFFVNSYAKESLRIRQHSRLVAINGEDVRDLPFDKTDQKLQESMKDLPQYPLRIRFMDEEGRPHLRHFTERPLGIQFTSNAPIQVSYVEKNSPAGADAIHKDNPDDTTLVLEGDPEPYVKVGWYIIEIGDEEVNLNTNFKEVMNYIKEGVSLLPHKDNQYKRLFC